MKTVYYHLSILLLAALLVSSCTSTRKVAMDTMRPADISLPTEINTLLLVDRTKFAKEFHNIAEGILTGEMPGQDKAALQATLASLSNTLQHSPRFSVKIATDRLIGNSLTSAFPDPLKWNEIEDLCNKYGADAVVAIELFDSDFIVTQGSHEKKKTVGEGDNKREVTVQEFYAEGVANIVMGIRVYDPVHRNVIDQDLFRHTNTWQESADSPAEALARLIDRNAATSRMARIAGSDYAYKIAPMPIQVVRTYYKKSKRAPEILAGSRRAEVNDWEGAARVWKNGLKDTGVKEAGRLSYNLAVASEVMGDYEAALIWAKESYVKYGNKKARAYVSLLEQRMWNEETARDQLSR